MARFWCAAAGLCLLVLTTSASAAIDRAKLRWERDKPPIEQIAIEGNEFYSDDEIKDRMYSKIRTFWKALKGDRQSRIQRETLGRDTLEIKFMYLSHGFLGVQVEESFEIIMPDSSARVRVRIYEGKQFLCGKKSMQGEFPDHLSDEFQDKIKRIKTDKPINVFDLHQAAFDMKTVLANNGYPYGKVTQYIDTTTGQALTPIRFAIETDSLVRFGEVTIRGLDRYPVYTARRELKIEPGDIYRRSAILESQRRLFESGYFTTSQLRQAEEQLDRLRPDFVLNVRERKSRYVNVTTGAGQSEAADLVWSLSTGAGKRNLFGSRKIDLLTDLEFKVGSDSRITDHNYRLRYTEPWLLGIRMPLAVTFTIQPPIRDKADQFDVRQWSVALSTAKRFSERTRVNWGFEYQSVDIDGLPADISEEERRRKEGLSVRRRLYANFVRDSRDFAFVPRTGSVRELAGEYYGGFLGGDDSFFRLMGSWSVYRPAWPGWISASRIRVEWTESFGASDNVPPQDRLFLGGANSIRGFRENTLAPEQDDGLPGAEFTALINQEFRWKTIQFFNPLPWIGDIFKSFPLWQSIFFDMGQGSEQADDFRLSGFAYSYGTGLQIISPAGPIRIDYARRIKTDSIDFADRWHFTILYAF